MGQERNFIYLFVNYVFFNLFFFVEYGKLGYACMGDYLGFENLVCFRIFMLIDFLGFVSYACTTMKDGIFVDVYMVLNFF